VTSTASKHPHPRSGRRRTSVRLFAALFATATITAACGGDAAVAPSEPDPAPAETEAPAVDQPEALDQRYIWATPAAPTTLDTTVSGVNALARIRFMGNTSSQLTHFGVEKVSGFGCDAIPGLEDLEGELAESWDVLDGGTRIRFTLRDGVVSDSGNTLSSADVEWSFQRWVAGDAVARSLALNQASIDIEDPITVIDPLTFDVHLTEPNVLAPAILAFPWFKIYDAAAVIAAAGPGDEFGSTVLDTTSLDFSPFRVAAFEPEVSVVYERVESWVPPASWEGLAGNVGQFVLQAVPDGSTRAQLILSGQVDRIDGLGFDQWSVLDSDPGVNVSACSSGRRDALALNQDNEKFTDVRVRRAISMGIDRASLAQVAYAGYARPALSGISSEFEHRAPSTEFTTFDPAAARALLAEAGYGPGEFSFVLEYTPSGNVGAELEAVAIQLQAQLRENIGVEVELRPSTTNADLQERLASGVHDAYLFDESPLLRDASYAAGLHLVSSVRQHWMGWRSEAFDDLQARARRSQVGPARDAVLADLAALVIDEMPVVYLAEVQTVIGVRSNISQHPFVSANLTPPVLVRVER